MLLLLALVAGKDKMTLFFNSLLKDRLSETAMMFETNEVFDVLRQSKILK